MSLYLYISWVINLENEWIWSLWDKCVTSFIVLRKKWSEEERIFKFPALKVLVWFWTKLLKAIKLIRLLHISCYLLRNIFFISFSPQNSRLWELGYWNINNREIEDQNFLYGRYYTGEIFWGYDRNLSTVHRLLCWLGIKKYSKLG